MCLVPILASVVALANRAGPTGHALLREGGTTLHMATKTSHLLRPLIALVALVALMTVVHASPAQAATLTVNTLADEQNTNGLCSLREAVINADNNNQTGSTDCVAGSGNDTITFTVSGQITLNSMLPNITDPAGLTISNPIGPVTDAVTISGNNATGMFTIEKEAELTLDNLILSDSFGEDGAITNEGTLTVTNSIVSGFSGVPPDDTSGAAAIGNIGTLTVSHSTSSPEIADRALFLTGAGARLRLPTPPSRKIAMPTG
jgi:CSLREA domain-containing protein